MVKKRLLKNKTFLIWSVSVGILTAVFSLAPQIDLWLKQGENWKGTYAITDYDEPFYAAYLQSLIDGKPRRNSPYTGAVDTVDAPQKESYLSIQFLAFYPASKIAQWSGLSVSGTMILLGALTGFLSAIVVFQLIYIFFKDAFAAFAGTVFVIFGGALAAGQGDFLSTVTGGQTHYLHSLIFLRRVLPAAAFPFLFLFFIGIWKFVSARAKNEKILWGIFSTACFSVNVFSYFYFWTTAAAWLFGLTVLWAVFRFEDLRKHAVSLLILAGGLTLPLIFYFFLLQNRSTDVDAALALTATRQPDLWRIPEIISYFSILIFSGAAYAKLINLRSPKILFLLSFGFAAPIVFNQQILTGYTLQPFHYQFFSANYIALFVFVAVVFRLLQKKISIGNFHRMLLPPGMIILMIAYFDTSSGVNSFSSLNVQRDELMPAARRIKEAGADRRNDLKSSSTVMSFDLLNEGWADGFDIPALTSQPVLWQINTAMFPDGGKNENLTRLYKFIYYHNFDEKRLEKELKSRNFFLTYGFFGAEKTSDIYTGESSSAEEENIEKIVGDYAEFRKNFSYADAQSPEIAFLIISKNIECDFSSVDRWYERDGGENLGGYILYRVKLRDK